MNFGIASLDLGSFFFTAGQRAGQPAGTCPASGRLSGYLAQTQPYVPAGEARKARETAS